MFEVSVSINSKTVALSLFSETCLKPSSLADIFRLHKYQVLPFINAKDNKEVIRQVSEKF